MSFFLLRAARLSALMTLLAVTGCSGSRSNPRREAGSEGGAPRDGGPTGDAGRDAEDAGSDVWTAPHIIDASGPYLEALGVSGAAQGLVPTFSPDTHDYYVRCAAGVNHLQVAMTASSGAVSSVDQPGTPSPRKHEQTVAVDADAGVLVVAAATSTDGKLTNAYYVRCLPPDFPPLTMTTYLDAGTPAPGYYLVGNYTPQPGESGYAMIVDGNGVPVWYSAPAPSGQGVFDTESLHPGEVDFCPSPLRGSYPFHVEALSTTSPTVTEVSPAKGETMAHHELLVLANGHYILLSNELTTGVDLTGLTISRFDGGVLGKNETIEDCTMLELSPTTHEVLWRWHASEHFDPVTASVHTDRLLNGDGGTSIFDPFHCTSIDIDVTTGNLLVSGRYMSSVFLVEYPSGRVLWKMGGPQSSKDSPPPVYVSVDDPFGYQHDGRLHGWAPGCHGGTGQVSVFDDRAPTQSGFSRATLYDVVVGGSGADGCPDAGAFDGDLPSPGSARLAWALGGTSRSIGGGSLRTLPDGSRIVGWGFALDGKVLTELDPGGRVVRELTFPSNDSTYRALKVPLETFDLPALRASAGR